MPEDGQSQFPPQPCDPTCVTVEYNRIIAGGGTESDANAAIDAFNIAIEAGASEEEACNSATAVADAYIAGLIVCPDGTEQSAHCGVNGIKRRTCANGIWGAWGDCVETIDDTPIEQPISSFGKTRYLFNDEIHRPLGAGEVNENQFHNALYSQPFYEDLFAWKEEHPYDEYINTNEPLNIKDKIRRRAGKYWSGHRWLGSGGARGVPYRISHIYLEGEDGIMRDKDISIEKTDAITQEHYEALIRETYVYSSSRIHYTDRLPEFRWYYDHAFKITTPVTKSDFDPDADMPKLYANINPNYNFHIISYEEVASNIPERFLPNMYIVASVSENPYDYTRSQESWHKKHGLMMHRYNMSLEGHLVIDKYKFNPTQVNDIISDRYLEDYAYMYNNNPTIREGIEAPHDIYSTMNKNFKNLIITHSNYDLLKSYSAYKYIFPMYFEIEFSTPTNTKFADLLKNTDISGTLMKIAIRNNSSWISDIPFYEYLVHTGPSPLASTSSTRRAIDLSDFFKSRLLGFLNFINMNPAAEDSDFDGVYLGNIDAKEENIRNDFYQTLSMVKFKEELVKIADTTKIRSFKQIMDGELAHSETVMYRIEKSEKKTIEGEDTYEVIQSFYLPNSNEIDVQRFIDTQVQYGKKYKYTVYAWELVFGSKYRYISRPILPPHADAPNLEEPFQIEVELKPDIRLIEAPYFTYESIILDKPPIAPNIEIIPFLGINNRVKINLSPNIGSHKIEPVAFELGEQIIINAMLESQGRIPGDLLEYRSDDYISMYEIYRINFHPKSYNDFFGEKLKDVSTDADPDIPGSATSASTMENLIPNKKYWYTFRSKDSHNHVSFPTPVYQVEIVDDDGAIYPLINIVEFREEVLTQNSKPLKKIMQILPAFPHTVPNSSEFEGKSSIIDDYLNHDLFTLGVEDESLWDKVFKIRLTSKKTGKKIDIKVKFISSHNDTLPN